MTTREIGTIQLGAVPATVEPKAAALLAQLRPEALDAILSSLQEWAEHSRVKCARLMHVVDPEDTFWEEAVLELQVDADTAQSSVAWDEVAAALDKAKAELPSNEQVWLDRHFDVHVAW